MKTYQYFLCFLNQGDDKLLAKTIEFINFRKSIREQSIEYPYDVLIEKSCSAFTDNESLLKLKDLESFYKIYTEKTQIMPYQKEFEISDKSTYFIASLNDTQRKKLNEHFFNKMKNLNFLNYEKHKCGLEMWSFKMKDFYNITLEFFIKDMFTYLEKIPNMKKIQNKF